MASDVNVHLPHLPASIGLEESASAALVMWLNTTHAQSHQVGAPSYPTININDNSAYTTILDALQVRRSLDVIIPHLYLYLLSSFASGHPPFKNYMGVDEIEETLTTQNEKLFFFIEGLLLSIPWIV